jgi:predicted TIM-barrel fold metal-dependent hydrolase
MTATMRVVDTDSYVRPAMELLYEQGRGEFRGRWDELKPFLELTEHPRADRGDWAHPWLELAVVPAPAATAAVAGNGDGGTAVARRWEPDPGPGLAEPLEEGILQDNPAGRLRLLDRAGIDVQLIGPGPVPWLSAQVGPDLSVGLIEAYNRYIVTYCEADPARLKAVLLVHGGDPAWSAEHIRLLAGERCVAAVAICLPSGIALDDPSLEPIWREITDADLPLFHHAFIEGWPSFPGHRDIVGNAAVAGAAAPQWSAQRALAFLVLGGLLERHPRLRVGFAGAGMGWLPSWLCQLRGQARRAPRSAPGLDRDPFDYVREGRIYAGLEPYEGEALAASVMELVGSEALLYQSHLPYGETTFPDAPDGVLAWSSVPAAVQRKVLAENAERFLRII